MVHVKMPSHGYCNGSYTLGYILRCSAMSGSSTEAVSLVSRLPSTLNSDSGGLNVLVVKLELNASFMKAELSIPSSTTGPPISGMSFRL